MAELSIEWTQTDSEGLVRVIPTVSFSQGVLLVAALAQLAEQYDYNPEVKLQSKKVTVWLIDESSSEVTEREIAFARQIDGVLES